MPKISARLTNERRDQVWALMLRGHNPQSIKKTLNISGNIVYRDIRFLTTKSKEFMYSMAKGTHVLYYQRCIDGVSLTLSEAWNKFNDPKVPEKLKVSYLRLTKDCSESIMQLTINGPCVSAISQLRERIEKAGINVDFDFNIDNKLDNNNSRDDEDKQNDDNDKRDNGDDNDDDSYDSSNNIMSRSGLNN